MSVEEAREEIASEVGPGVPTTPLEGWMEKICAWACGLALIATLVITTIEVVGRSLFHFSLQISDDFGGYLLVGMTFISLAYCQVTNAFHKIELVQGRMKRRGRAILSLVFLFVSIAFVALVTYYLTLFAWDSWKSGATAPSYIEVPMWIPQSTMPLGMALLLISLIKTAIVDIRRLRAGLPTYSGGGH